MSKPQYSLVKRHCIAYRLLILARTTLVPQLAKPKNRVEICNTSKSIAGLDRLDALFLHAPVLSSFAPFQSSCPCAIFKMAINSEDFLHLARPIAAAHPGYSNNVSPLSVNIQPQVSPPLPHSSAPIRTATLTCYFNRLSSPYSTTP